MVREAGKKALLENIVNWLTEAIGQFGYPGIILLMALESSFFPFPSEVVIPPAAYLATSGHMDIAAVVLCGTVGSLIGSIFNYWLALKFGRPFFQKFGKYLLIKMDSLEKAERFFNRYGYISTFIGRLIPGIRQYISLPAGLARMNITAFCSATTLGAGIWVMILAATGYWFGNNEQLVKQNLHWITLALIFGCGLFLFFYWLKNSHLFKRKG